MKLGIEGDSPDSISQYCSINADNSWLNSDKELIYLSTVS